MNDPQSGNIPPERIPYLELDGESIPDNASDIEPPPLASQPVEPRLRPPAFVPSPGSQSAPTRWFRLADLPRSQLLVLAGAILVLILLLPRLILVLSVFMAEILILLRLALIPLVAFMVAAMLLRWVNARPS